MRKYCPGGMPVARTNKWENRASDKPAVAAMTRTVTLSVGAIQSFKASPMRRSTGQLSGSGISCPMQLHALKRRLLA
jgi:hypothetical protein